MRAPACAASSELVAEWALGILDEPQRVALEAHLAGCPACRAEAAAAEVAAAEVAAAAPPVEPPPDLVVRVLSRLPIAPGAAAPEALPPEPASLRQRGADEVTPVWAGAHRAWRRRRAVVVALAVAAVVLVALVGGVVGRQLAPGPGPTATAVRSGELTTGEGRAIGTAVVFADRPWMALHLTAGRPGALYGCQVVLDDGTVVELGRWAAGEGGSDWSGELPVDPDRVRAVQVTGSGGGTWASVELG